MLNTDTPLISIITAVYNGADYLPALIESVLAQDYRHYEHIIVDDGSTDAGATVAVLERYPHLRWWSRENKGQYATQNEGLAAAQGDIIVVISADDMFASADVFSQVVAYWQVHPEVELVYGKTLRMDVLGNPIAAYDFVTGPSKWLLRHYCYVQHCSLFVARKLIEGQQITFNPDLQHAGDWDWIIRLFDASTRVAHVKMPFGVIRTHPNQTSRSVTTFDEYRYICDTYGGSFFLYRLFRRLAIVRAMLLLGLDTLRKRGLGQFIRVFAGWLRRRLT